MENEVIGYDWVSDGSDVLDLHLSLDKIWKNISEEISLFSNIDDPFRCDHKQP